MDTGPEPGSHEATSLQDLQLVTVGQGVSPASGYAPDGTSTRSVRGDNQQVQIAAGPWEIPVSVPIGTVLQGFGVQLIDNGGATPNTLKIELLSSIAGSIGSLTSQGNGTEQGWVATFGSPYTTSGGEVLWLRASPLLASGAYATAFSTIESVTLIRPSPPAVTTIAIDASAFHAITDATAVDHSNGCAFSGGVGVEAPLAIPQGATITAARFYIRDSSATVIQGEIKGRDPSNNTVGAITSGSSGNGTPQVLSTQRPLTVATSRGYSLRVTYFSGNLPSSVAFAEVDYKPAM